MSSECPVLHLNFFFLCLVDVVPACNCVPVWSGQLYSSTPLRTQDEDSFWDTEVFVSIPWEFFSPLGVIESRLPFFFCPRVNTSFVVLYLVSHGFPSIAGKSQLPSQVVLLSQKIQISPLLLLQLQLLRGKEARMQGHLHSLLLWTAQAQGCLPNSSHGATRNSRIWERNLVSPLVFRFCPCLRWSSRWLWLLCVCFPICFFLLM